MMKKWTMFVFLVFGAALTSCNSFDDIYLSASCRPAVIKVNNENKYTFTYNGNKIVSTVYSNISSGKVLATVKYVYNDKNQISKFSTFASDTSAMASEYTEVEYNEGGNVSKETTFEKGGTTDTYVQTEYVVYTYDNRGRVLSEMFFEGTSTTFKKQKRYEYDVRDNKWKMYLKEPLKDEYLAEKYIYDDNKGIDSALPAPLKGDKNNLIYVEYFNASGKITFKKRFSYNYAGNDTRYPVSYEDPYNNKKYAIEYICR